MNGEVSALAVSGANLYAGGQFTTAGGVSANYIAQWDGNAWSSLGSGIGGSYLHNPYVWALAMSGANLYAGGEFTTAGGVPANRIAKWNGSAWSALGSGMTGMYDCVWALAVSGTDLYAGGYFTNAGGVPANHIAKWNGSAWSGPGAGLNGTVYALPADGAGHLFVGGFFTLAGATVCPCIAEVNLSNAPTILMPPQSQTASQGHPVDFTVDVAGTPPLNLQWFFNYTNDIAGATNSELQLTNVQFSQSGSYTVVVTNLFGSATSSPAILNVIGVAPTIVTPPMAQPARVGGTVNFSVSAAGSLPLTYQWFFNDTNVIAGAGDSVLRLTSIQTSQSGTYAVVVTNLVGSVTSSPVMLTVAPAAVVTNCTEATLRASLGLGGIVTFACDGTIRLGSTITFGVDTILDGSGHQVTISGGNLVQVFQVHTNVSLTLINLTIANGSATNGAGLLNAGGTVNITNCVFSRNSALGTAAPPSQFIAGGSVGGGAVANEGVLNLVNCTFKNNSVSGGAGSDNYLLYGDAPGGAGGSGIGGAVWNSGFLLASGCTFAGNFASGGAGGAGGNGDLIFRYCCGSDGGAGGGGGGGALFNCGTARLVNCTLASNTGQGGGGGRGGFGSKPNPDDPPGPNGQNGTPGLSVAGIYDASGQCYLTNCTVAFNSGTGIWTTGTNGTRLINTLLSGNSPGGNGSGAMTDLGHNLSSDTTCTFTNTGSMNNTYPALRPLADNGGPTLTVALLPGCRAIDAGDTTAVPPTDQRGVARPFGMAADIGAYEFNGATNAGGPVVVTNCTEANLIAATAAGGRVTFACDGTITLSKTMTFSLDTVLDGTGHQITISGFGKVRVFCVNPNVTLSMSNLTITGGYADSGGALKNSGTLTMDQCTFNFNSAAGTNGDSSPGYWADGGSGGDAAGGAIYNLGGLTVSRSAFNNNSVVGGNGGNGTTGYHGDPGMNAGSGGNGGAGGNGKGGAIYNAGSARVINSTFATDSGGGGNGGAGGEGGISFAGPGNGGGGGYGGAGGTGVGALYNVGYIQIINSTFTCGGSGGSGGTAGNGGVEYPSPGYGGGRGGNGGAGGTGVGGLFNLGSAEIINSTFACGGSGRSGGTAGNGGSGNFGGSGGAGGNGGSGIGAIYGQSSSCRITNCTFAGNSGGAGSGGSGGAAGSGGGGSPGAAGSAGSGVGGISNVGAFLVNTLLAANFPNYIGSITDGGHNLSSDSSCGLGPLADNGAPTWTMALLPGSPAIDAGDNASAPPTDQRGFPRPAGVACDIGAYEWSPPSLTIPPSTQTAEIGTTVELTAQASTFTPATYQWFFNGNAISGCTNSVLCLSGVQATNIGAYTLVVCNIDGVKTSSPAMLNVIPVVERRPVPAVKVAGEAGSLLNVDYANSLGPSPNWIALGSVTLTNTSQFCPDVSTPLPSARFYRAWQTGTPAVLPSLNLDFVPAITLTGNVGDSLRLDYINQFGPTNAWVTLDTVTLTNTSQLYFDVTAPGQPQRLYRIVPNP
jgi:hypothetical protein